MMYEVHVEVNGEWRCIHESDNYKLAYNVFDFYAGQAWLFNITRIMFLDYSIPEYPTSIDVTEEMIANLKAKAVA